MYIYSVLYAFDDRTVNDSLTSFARVLPAEGHPRRGNARVHLAPRDTSLTHKTQKTKTSKKDKKDKKEK